MIRIASPVQARSELQRILRMSQESAPSRHDLAQALSRLARRVVADVGTPKEGDIIEFRNGGETVKVLCVTDTWGYRIDGKVPGRGVTLSEGEVKRILGRYKDDDVAEMVANSLKERNHSNWKIKTEGRRLLVTNAEFDGLEILIVNLMHSFFKRTPFTCHISIDRVEETVAANIFGDIKAWGDLLHQAERIYREAKKTNEEKAYEMGLSASILEGYVSFIKKDVQKVLKKLPTVKGGPAFSLVARFEALLHDVATSRATEGLKVDSAGWHKALDAVSSAVRGFTSLRSGKRLESHQATRGPWVIEALEKLAPFEKAFADEARAIRTRIKDLK